MVVMLQILQSNCNYNDLIYGFGIKSSMPKQVIFLVLAYQI